ncbi:hypothetical protein [Massilia glaciei]|uniref:Uncharacterized protein n=1 Tax=Massilia glaciei TaxID=1524097 RepID=A0A2U2HN93_9BURK|nr:hypothetical protein [Massilia glaciei]PWF48885.1 hypothetical protein C7C56_009510 [Massilia glaciei]
MKSIITIVSAGAALAASCAALAHGVLTPQYGGQVAKVNDVSYELVATKGSIAVYVDDHGQKVDVAGGKGKLLLVGGGAKTSVALLPAGGNKLEAKGNFKLAAGTKVVSVVTLSGKASATARYELK